MFATTINWTKIDSRLTSAKDTNRFLAHIISEGILIDRMKKADASYDINTGSYPHSPRTEPTNDLNTYDLDINEDLGFTMNIDGIDFIIARVSITSRVYSHRTATYLVAVPDECTDRYFYTEVENNRW